jgi:vitamin B12 transporter
MISFLLLASVAVPDTIIVTGSREPLAQADVPAASTVLDEAEIDALAFPLAADALRLVPGLSVSAAGPRGSQTQVRIRGAEAGHSLLFVDGIRFNDPAAGNEARFELLPADLLSRIEVVRGPQSALWGSEALGGVIAVATADPFARRGVDLIGEYGSFDSSRLAGQATAQAGDVGFAASGAWLRSDGIDSFASAPGGSGDLDGFDQRSLSLRTAWRPAEGREFGISAFYVAGTSEYDGLDLNTFVRADTEDSTQNRIAAVRGWGKAELGDWSLSAEASLLDSANRNLLGDDPLNRTAGRRVTAGGQVSRRFAGHRLTAAVSHEAEDFQARDQIYFGGTDQDRSRSLTAVAGEWHAAWSNAFATDIAVRHDSFSAFRDATTLRAAALLRPAAGWTLHAAYGEGIAQPTFYDLHGFFPGSFTGNPGLRPERSRGWEAGLRWENDALSLAAVAYSSRLRDEIVDVFFPDFSSSTRNVDGASRRRGIELSADYRVAESLRLSLNYSYLDADERREPADAAIREVRRPRHSANAAAYGTAGRLSWSASAAYVGARADMDFDVFPARRVVLDDYVLASARVGWRLTDAIEAFGRIENALDEDYQDVVGYRTAGRSVHAGLRLRLGD